MFYLFWPWVVLVTVDIPSTNFVLKSTLALTEHLSPRGLSMRSMAS